MSTVTLEAKHKLSSRLSAESVDTAHSIIRGATVAKSGVQATGKFVMLDASGKVTNDPEEMATEVPVFTDETTLTTLMAAAKAAGKRIKVRTDHIDEVGARAGYADEFKLDQGRVAADIHLFKSFSDREVVLETALETPEEIGLSIDFTPSFELRDGRAYMRVSELHAVDIVDEGAITPEGLLLSASVDTTRKVEPPRISQTQPAEKMAAATPPTNEELMSAIGSLSTAVGALTKTVGEMQTKLNAPPAEEKKGDGEMNAVKELTDKFAALQTQVVQMKREKALLGFRGTSEERAKLATAQPEEIEKAANEKKDYMKLVSDRVASAKCKKSEAHVWVMKNHPTEYAAHLAAKGVVRMNAAA